MLACDMCDMLPLNLTCVDAGCLKNKSSVLIDLKKGTEKVKKATRNLLFIAFSRLTGWGLRWEEVKSPGTSYAPRNVKRSDHQMKFAGRRARGRAGAAGRLLAELRGSSVCSVQL